MINGSSFSVTERKELVLAALNKGLLAKISFKKKDGSIREAQVKLWAEKGITYGLDDIQPNPVQHIPTMVTCWDINKPNNPKNPTKNGKGDWINVELSRLTEFTSNGIRWTF